MSQTGSSQPIFVTIREVIPVLTKSERAVAEYILNNSENVLHISIYELAEACGTSDATVIRTFRKFGLTSFHELKIMLAQDMVSPAKLVSSDIENGDSEETVITKIYNGIINTISMTKGIDQSEQIIKAADTLYHARHIFLLGLGGSGSVAGDFQHKLLRLGLNASYLSDVHMQRLYIENYVGSGDVIFAVSHSGSSKLIVDAALIGKNKGATLITLTDIAKSTLKKNADIALCTMSEETKYNLFGPSSKIASYAIVDILYLLISYMYQENSLKNINRADVSMKDLKY